MKTNKTLSKRIKVTKNGKVLKKSIRAGHLKVKWNTSKKYRKRGNSELIGSGYKKLFKKLLPKGGIK